ncbi:MAG TPA: FAD-binding protein, partial [Acidimicrobiia bacterium]|nr:FAD-binding protein [Acidimicrobiia bacterium]
MTTLDSLIGSGLITADVPLGPFTTYKSGGPARYLAEVPDAGALDDLVASGVIADMAVLVLGRGSNLVVSDAGFDGLVIRLGQSFGGVEVDGTEVRAGGAAPLAQVARTSVEAGLTGLEFFIGVPGSVGGAVRQNAGCFGTETRDRLIEASIVDLGDGIIGRFGPDDLELSYRHSNVTSTRLVLGATFRSV